MTNCNKKRGFFKLSFVEIRTFVPTDSAVERGDRRCICEIECQINIKDALSKTGIGINDWILKIIDRHIPVSMISYIKNGHVKTEKFINERFTVTAVATCSEEDDWSPAKGRMISRAKAKKKAFRKAFNIYKDIFTHLVSASEDILKSMKFVNASNNNEEEWIKYILEK